MLGNGFNSHNQLHYTMASNYNTPGVPEPEVSATAMRELTRARPNDQAASAPKVYGEWLQTQESVQRNADHNGIIAPNPN